MCKSNVYLVKKINELYPDYPVHYFSMSNAQNKMEQSSYGVN